MKLESARLPVQIVHKNPIKEVGEMKKILEETLEQSLRSIISEVFLKRFLTMVIRLYVFKL